jgi:broad specificity phosphatase PhoE
MKLLLVRHGETESNVKDLMIGNTEDPLNEKGMQQAEKIAMRLKDEKIDRIFCSRMKRARQTADAINKYHRKDIVIAEELVERHFGQLEGRPREEFRENAKKKGVSYYDYRPEGGESSRDVQERVMKFLNRLIEKYPEETILIVTHGVVITTILLDVGKISTNEYRKLMSHNTGLSVIEVTGKREIKLINCTKHLE